MIDPGVGAHAYFDMLFRGAAPGSLVEVRYRLSGGHGMGQVFVAADRPGSLLETIEGLGKRTDTFVGVAPRTHRRGGRDAVRELHALWVDCDTPESIELLGQFSAKPGMVNRSGAGVHAYWPLATPCEPDVAEAMNRRLAHVLKADRKATDAARILRPPGTFNYKTGTPQPVYVVRLDYDRLYIPADLGRHAPPLPVAVVRSPRGTGSGGRDGNDALLAIPAAEYAEVLSGRSPNSGGYITCPFHAGGTERTPSLKLYEDGSWACFGSCEPEPGRGNAGGDVYSYASRLWGLSSRSDFPELRRLLSAVLLGKATAV